MSTDLHSHHRQMLEHESGIKPDIIERRGYKTATVKAELKRLGFSDRQCRVPSLLMPLYGPTGEVVLYQSRPDRPRIGKKGKPIKYETPGKSRMALDVHPSMRDKLGNPKVPLFITEGIKKADALTSHDLCTVGLLGVYNFRGKNEHGGKVVLADWEYIAPNRKVYIVFDSDVMEKRAVYGALVRLKDFLGSRGADVFVIYLPSGEGGAKQGVDDYLASGHSVDDLSALATDKLKKPPRDTDRGPYVIENGVICRVKATPDGEMTIPLCNFTACIIEQVRRDDGAERTSLFIIEGTAQDGRALPRAEVPTTQFAPMNWPVAQWENDAVVYAGQGNKDHLRAAIQLTSKPERRTIYTHTGWRHIGDEDVYLHAGGATGKDGMFEVVQVELSGELQNFALPSVSDANVADAVRKSLALLDLAPDRITMPLLAAPYRAVLGEPDFGLHLAGVTGALKTATAALIQQHFGAQMDAKHLPGSWSSTANALEALLWLGKDAVTVIDDFIPTGSAHDVARYHATADRILRAGANHAGRRRMKPDTTMRPDHPPRSLTVSTGEDIPKGHSLRARMLVLDVEKGDVNKDRLTAAQAEARAGTYATALAGFITYLAEDLSGYQQRFSELHLAERNGLHTVLPRDAHPRTADIGGQLLATWTVILEYATHIKALTAEEADTMRRRASAGILQALEPQAHHQAASDPVPRFVDLIGALLSSGKAHVSTPDGKYPGEGYGWREAVSESGNSYLRPLGTQIGWRSDSELWLEPDVAYAEASKLAREQNDAIAVTARTLWKRLAGRGLIQTEGEGNAKHNTLKRKVEGNKRRVIILSPYPTEITGDIGDEGEKECPEQDSPVPGEETQPGTTGDEAEKPGTGGDEVPGSGTEPGTKNGQETPSQTEASPVSPESPVILGTGGPEEKSGEGASEAEPEWGAVP